MAGVERIEWVWRVKTTCQSVGRGRCNSRTGISGLMQRLDGGRRGRRCIHHSGKRLARGVGVRVFSVRCREGNVLRRFEVDVAMSGELLLATHMRVSRWQRGGGRR